MTDRSRGGPGDPPPAVEISLVGPLRVVRYGEDVTPSSPKLRQLLALLVLSASEVVRIETIVREMWGTTPSVRIGRTLQTYVCHVRKLLDVGPASGDEPSTTITCIPQVGYRLTLGPTTCVDMFRLRELAAAAGTGDLRSTLEPLRAALEICRGPVLSDVRLGAVLAEQKVRLDATRIGVLSRYLSTLLELGDAPAAVAESPRVEAEDSRYEELHAHLILALTAVGRRGEAIDMFHRVRRARLGRTGIEPGPALQGAFQRALGFDVAALQPVTRSAVPLTWERIPRPAQLPVDLHPFIGRRIQLRTAVDALVPSGVRFPRTAVLVVVGGPGSGRSAFCARVAEQASVHYPDGQLYTDLKGGPSEALAGFLRALGVEDVPAGFNERVRAYRSRTASRRILVLADNATSPDALRCLVPESLSSALVMASSVRPAVDRRSAVLELPRLSPQEQANLFARRIGPERVANEPVAAHAVMRRCRGLPLALNAAIARILMRPHWSLARLAASGPALSVAGFDLANSMLRCLDQLDATERTELGLLAAVAGTRPLSVRAAATELGVRVERAEHVLERLVEIRLADPIGHGNAVPAGKLTYRLDPLYRDVIKAIDRPHRDELTVDGAA